MPLVHMRLDCFAAMSSVNDAMGAKNRCLLSGDS